MTETVDVAIVGAGVIGLALARRLGRLGMSVLLVERGPQPGREASWAAAGMLAPSAEAQPGEEALVALGQRAVERYRDWVAQLQAETGLDVDHAQGASLIVAVDRDDAALLRHTMVLQQRLGLAVEWLTPSRARDLEPGLGPRIMGAIESPLDHRVDNRKLVAALSASLGALAGVELRCGVEAALWIECEHCLGLTLGAEQRVRAGTTVVCAGVGSPGLGGLPDAVRPPVRPVKGQALCVAFEDGITLAHTVRTPRVYMVPRRDGRLVIGATSEEKGFDRRLTAGGLYTLLEAAYEVFPGVAELPLLETWSGLRPASRDNLPLIGPTALPGLWLSTGHYRNGILLAEVSAALVSGLLAGDDDGLGLDPAPFLPARFG